MNFLFIWGMYWKEDDAYALKTDVILVGNFELMALFGRFLSLEGYSNFRSFKFHSFPLQVLASVVSYLPSVIFPQHSFCQFRNGLINIAGVINCLVILIQSFPGYSA